MLMARVASVVMPIAIIGDLAIVCDEGFMGFIQRLLSPLMELRKPVFSAAIGIVAPGWKAPLLTRLEYYTARFRMSMIEWGQRIVYESLPLTRSM